jgi:hypothetical protein
MEPWTLPNALQLLHQQFPGAFVTSGKRDPNSALGRANPRSYHNIGEAFDIRPMQGVGFDQYVSSLKNAGLPVVEALDEAKNPKPWTTGPNWHVAFASQPKEEKKPMLTPEQRAAMFTVAIPGEDPQQFNIQKAMAAMVQAQQPPAAPQALPMEQRKDVPLWVKILGSLGDAYSKTNGREGSFLPTLQAANQGVDERNFDREKLNAEMEVKQQELASRLQEPPPFIQNLQAWQALDPATKKQYLQYQDATNPITVATPQGTQAVPRTSTKVIGGKTYYKIGDQWFEEGN